MWQRGSGRTASTATWNKGWMLFLLWRLLLDVMSKIKRMCYFMELEGIQFYDRSFRRNV